jgi:hypothetical protein
MIVVGGNSIVTILKWASRIGMQVSCTTISGTINFNHGEGVAGSRIRRI